MTSATAASQTVAPPAAPRPRIAALFVSDQPARFAALQRSALAGRPVHFWIADGGQPPGWSTGLRGDPADPATYAPLAGQEAIVVIDLADEALAMRVARAVRRALPRPAVLLIDRRPGRRHAAAPGGITWIDEGDLLADAIELVLRRVSSRKRVLGLQHALHGRTSCAFLLQNDPDPDAIASALALRRTLDLSVGDAPIVTVGQITRPENRRLIAELGIRVQHVEPGELSELAPLILVDVQPPYFKHPLPEVAAVVDHHPVTGRYRAGFRDVRTTYGASATMAAEYLLADHEAELTTPLATALLYGIMTDTRSLSRSASQDDLEMFAYLFPRADHVALRRIQHPSYSPLALRRFGAALEGARADRGLAYLHLGRLPGEEEHVAAQFAEFCLGIAGAEIAVVSGVFDGKLVMSARALHPEVQLGERLRERFSAYGSAGGHPLMAKAVVELDAWRRDHPARGERALERSVRAALTRLFAPAPRRRLSSRAASRARR